MELSFGEQIKILLKRKNMTIQDLATLYEQQTGSKMSRQNLTQRLKRDNFPEQDMHIIAALLGYQVSIQLTPVAIPIPEMPKTATVILPGLNPTVKPASIPNQTVEPVLDHTKASNQETIHTDVSPFIPDTQTSLEEASPEQDSSSGIKFHIPDAFRKNRPQGDINPLTGEEYLTNTVRRHPEIEEYVQVYDQSTHAWSDVREDYFWQFQEKKKQMLGKDYRAPILI